MEEQKVENSSNKKGEVTNSIIAILGVWISCLVIGYIAGRIQSPDFSQKRLVEDFFEKNSTYLRYNFFDMLKDSKKDKSNFEFVQTTKDFPAVLIPFDRNIYIYRIQSDSIKIIERNNLDYSPKGNGTLEISKEQFEKYALPSTALSGMTITKYYGLAKDIAAQSGNRKKWVQWAIKAAYVLGIGIGYNIGYENHPSSDNPFVQEVLHDKATWKNILERKEHQYSKLNNK